jgi:hypothetical protein
MSGDDQIKGWRDYRKLLPTAQLNDLLHRSDDSGWVTTRELLAQMGWTNLNRVVVITGDTLGRGTVYVLLPDETVADLSSEYGTYETCSVQEFADWDVQYAEPLWDAVVWLRYHMRHMRECTRALRTSDEPKWRALKAFVESEGFDPDESVVAELGPDQFEEIGEFVAKDRRRFIFEIPYKEAVISRWDEEPPDFDRYPQSYRSYDFACWLLDAAEGVTSNWIFTRPYDWWARIKPGWNPPFGRPTFDTAEKAALMAMNEDVVRVASIRQLHETKREITLEVDDDPSGQFPMTVVCEQMPNGRWRQVRAS